MAIWRKGQVLTTGVTRVGSSILRISRCGEGSVYTRVTLVIRHAERALPKALESLMTKRGGSTERSDGRVRNEGNEICAFLGMRCVRPTEVIAFLIS